MFIRAHLDFGDVIYHQPHNETFCRRIESVRYNTALAITGTIKGLSRKNQAFGLGALMKRRWGKKSFFNIVSYNSPEYLCSLLPTKQRSHELVSSESFHNFTSRTDYFNNYFSLLRQ